jgi:hypothetical protein
VVAPDTDALVAATDSSGTTGGVAVGGATGSTVPGVGFGCLFGLGSFLLFCPSVPVAGGFGDVQDGPESGGVGGRNGSAGASD